MTQELFDRVTRLIGKKSMQRVHTLRIGIAGDGVVGNPLSATWAKLGAKEIRNLDYDKVKRENLANTFLLNPSYIGKDKDQIATEISKKFSLRKLKVKSWHFDVTAPHNYNLLLKFVGGLDIVYGCFDNLPARLSLNTATITKNVKYLDIGIGGFAGRCRFINRKRACYACNPLATEDQLNNIYKFSEEADCDYAPTVTILPVSFGIISHAIIQGLKFLEIVGNEPEYDYIYYDFLSEDRPVKMKITKRKDCIICGKNGMVNWSDLKLKRDSK